MSAIVCKSSRRPFRSSKSGEDKDVKSVSSETVWVEVEVRKDLALFAAVEVLITARMA